MSLKAGNVNDLLRKNPNARFDEQILLPLLKQMLEALDYLAFRELFHRDVKPDNILYTPVNGTEYIFQLADFGLANHQALAKTQTGTPMFTAPEIYFHGHPQTSKMDVWSLFVTLASVTRTAGFDERKLKDYHQVLNVVRKAAITRLSSLSPMAREDPTLRVSAAQMLVQCFGGDGLTTPRRKIGPAPDPGESVGHIQARERVEPGRKEPRPKVKAPMGMAGIRKRGKPSQAESPRVLAKHVSKPLALHVQARVCDGRIPGAFPQFS
jgi:serine/threonine protein kinase